MLMKMRFLFNEDHQLTYYACLHVFNESCWMMRSRSMRFSTSRESEFLSIFINLL